MRNKIISIIILLYIIYIPLDLVFVDAQSPGTAQTIEIGPVGEVRWSPTDDVLAIVGRNPDLPENDHLISIWKATGELIRTLGSENDSLRAIRAIEWSPNGEMIAALDANYRLQLWQVNTGETMFSVLLDKLFTGRPVYVFVLTSLSWSPDGTHLAIGNDGDLSIVDITTQEGIDVARDETGDDIVAGVAWSPRGDKIAKSNPYGEIAIYDTENFEPLLVSPATSDWPIDFYETGAQFLAWRPDGSQIANFSAYPNTIFIHGVSAGEVVGVLGGHQDNITSITWSPDGGKLASTSEDGTIIIWDVDTFEKITTLEGHTDVVSSASWSSDSKFLASGSYDGTVRIWEID